MNLSFGFDLVQKIPTYRVYLALQAWVTDFDPFSFKRCHLCSGVRQKIFRPIDMHIACSMHEKQ